MIIKFNYLETFPNNLLNKVRPNRKSRLTIIAIHFFILLLLNSPVTLYSAAITSLTSGNWSATAWPNTARTGTITTTTTSTTVTGAGTSFQTELSVGSIIKTTGNVTIGTVASIQSNTSLTLTANAVSNNSGISYNSQGTGSVDAITIAAGASLTVDGDYTNASITFASNTTGSTITISGTNILTVSGGVTIPRAATGNINTFAVGAGKLVAASIAYTNGGGGVRHIITISTGTVEVSGNVTQSGSTGSASITFTDAGLLMLGGTFLTSSNGTLTTFAGSRVEYNRSGAQTIGTFTYEKLTLAGSGNKTLSTSITINDTLSIRGTAIPISATPVYGASAVLAYEGSSAQTTTIREFPATLGADVYINNTNGVTLNGAKTINGNLTINSGAFSASGSNYNVTLNGNFTNNGGSYTGGTSTVTFTGASKTIGGTTSTTFPNISIASGATFTMDSSNTCTTLAFVSSATASSLTLGTGNPTLTVNGALTIAQPSATSITTALNINGGTVTVSGLVSNTGTNVNARIVKIVTTSGTLNANAGITFTSSVATNNVIDMSGGAGTLNLTGAILVGTSTLTAGTANSTFNYASSGAQTIVAYSYYNLSNTGNGNRTLVSSGTINVAGTYTPTSGTITTTGSTVNYNGANGQTIAASNYNNLSSTNNTRILANGIIRIAGTFTPGSSNYTIGTSTVEFNGTTALTIPVLPVASGANYYHLAISGISGGGWEFAGELTIGGDLTISTSDAVIFNTTTSARTFTIGGDFIQSAGDIDLATGGTGGTTDLYLAGDLNHTGGTLWFSGFTGRNCIFYFNGSGIQSLTLNNLTSYTYINYTVESGATLQLGSNVNLNEYSAPEYSGVFTVNNGGTIIFPSTFTISMNGGSSSGSDPIFNLNSGATMITANAAGVNASVSSTSITRNFNSGANYEFNGASGQNCGLVNTTVNNFKTNLSGVLNLNSTATINGNCNLTQGTLTYGAFTVNIFGTVSRTSGNIDASNSSSSLTFTNTSSISLPTNVWGNVINNLTMNGTGGVTLGSNTTVEGVLNLTSGIITSASGALLIVDSLGTVTNASASSYVSGPVRKNGRNAFIFPVGKIGTGYQAIEISAPTTHTDAFTAEYVRADAITTWGDVHTSPITSVSKCEYWDLSRTAGTATVDVTLYGNSNSGCGSATGANYFTGSGTTLSTMRVIHWNGTAWENATASVTTSSGTSPNVTIKATGVSSFSPFTFGSTGLNPIPVKLVNFTVTVVENSAILEWRTATEINNDHFEIERSNDGITFLKVGDVKGNGTTKNFSDYIFTDEEVSKTLVPFVFYRLKQVDYDGTFDYSNTVKATFKEPNKLSILSTEPNPINGQLEVSFAVARKGLIEIQIADAYGRILILERVISKNGINSVPINTSELPVGVYFLTLKENGLTSNSKIIFKKS